MEKLSTSQLMKVTEELTVNIKSMEFERLQEMFKKVESAYLIELIISELKKRDLKRFITWYRQLEPKFQK